eukprot:m.93147 g.93147  ORF g.93147 m.93147 type:complete len:102 (-) comp13386_c1_seq1:57-362(-)
MEKSELKQKQKPSKGEATTVHAKGKRAHGKKFLTAKHGMSLAHQAILDSHRDGLSNKECETCQALVEPYWLNLKEIVFLCPRKECQIPLNIDDFVFEWAPS